MYSVQIWPGFLISSGHPPSRAPARPAAWRAAPWPAPCRWAPTCRTASAASPTRPGWSASRAGTSTATPVATRSSTWPSKISRACPTTPAPCASPSASSGASARPPPGTSTGPTASCSSSSSQGRSTGAGGVEAEASSAGGWFGWFPQSRPGWFLMHCLSHDSYVLTWTTTNGCPTLLSLSLSCSVICENTWHQHQ